LEQTLIRVVGRQETVVQKNRVKALDGDWIKCAETKTEVFCPPRLWAKFATQIVQKRSGWVIDRTNGLDRDRLEVSESAKWRIISPLCERLPSPPHSKDPIIITQKLCSPTLTMKTVTSVLMWIALM